MNEVLPYAMKRSPYASRQMHQELAWGQSFTGKKWPEHDQKTQSFD